MLSVLLSMTPDDDSSNFNIEGRVTLSSSQACGAHYSKTGTMYECSGAQGEYNEGRWERGF